MTAQHHGQFQSPPYADAEALVADAIAAALRPAPALDLAAWTEANIVFDAAEPFPGPYRLDLFPFFRRILEVLGPEHPAREVTFRKSAQIGGTIVANAFLLGWLDKHPAHLMAVHPSLNNGRKWVNGKIKPLVRNSAGLRAILSFDNPKDVKATELHFERLDARGDIIVTGANSPASLSQVSIKAMLQDDLAKWQNNDAGDPESQADSRCRAYEDAKIFKVSTPMVEGSCRITGNFLRGTQEHYHVPCPACGALQPLDWPNLQANIDAAGDASGAFFTCTADGCGGTIEERHRAWCIDPANGAKWVAHNPGAKRISFHLWTVYAPLTSWGRLAENYLAAKGDQGKEQTFLNDDLGLAFRAAGEAPEWTALRDRGAASEFRARQIAAGYYLLYAGVDVQKDRVEIGVWAFGPELRRQPVDHIVVSGSMTEEATHDALDAVLLRTTWPDAYGNARTIEHLEIDVGFEREHVLQWVKRHRQSLVTPVVGARSDNAPALGMAQTRQTSTNGKRVRAERTVFEVGGGMLKAYLYGDLRKTEPLSRGFVALGRDFPDDWYEQLTAEVRREVANRRGRLEWKWDRLTGRRNEVLDCAVYAHHCAERLGWKRLTPAQWDAIAADRDRPPSVPDLFTGDLAETVRPAPRAIAAAAATPAPAVDWVGDTSKWTA